MSFEMRYPAGSGGTASVVLDVDFDLRRSSQAPETDTVAQRVDHVVYSYRFGSGAFPWRYRRGFSSLTYAKVLALEAFFLATNGEPFDFKDGACGPITSFTKVALVPESYAREYGHVQAALMGVEFAMVETV